MILNLWNIVLVILFIVLLTALYFKFARIQEFFTGNFQNLCLTEKPYGNYSSAYTYWRNFPNLLAQQFADCDRYGCSTATQNGYTAKATTECSIKTPAGKLIQAPTKTTSAAPPEYYHNPEMYCAANPTTFPCPNFFYRDPPKFPRSNYLQNELLPMHHKCDVCVHTDA